MSKAYDSGAISRNTLAPRLLALLLAAGLATAADPGGAIPDGSFECGHDWWSLERSLYLDAGGGTAWLPAVDDPQQPGHGSQSLRVDNPRGDSWMLSSGDVALEPGVDYQFAFSARAAVADTVLRLGTVGRENDHWGGAGCGSWKLGTTWKRYVVTLAAASGHRWFYLNFRHDGEGGGATTGAVWLDAVQLRRAPADAAYDPPPVETGLREPARFYSLDSQGPWPADLRVRNHGDQPRSVVIAWEVVDTADGNRVGSGRSDPLEVAAAATAALTLDVSPRRRGSFDLRWQVLDAASGAVLAKHEHGHGFALVDPVPAGGGGGCAIGGQFSLRADWQASDWATRSTLVQRGCSLEDMIDYRIATGETWVRSNDFRWAALEPRPGEYDWRVTDLLIEACLARGLQVVVNTDTLLVSDNPQARFAKAPEWAQRRWPARAGGGSMACQICPAPAAEWARYLGAAAARYRGKVTAWEILNEPNLWLGVEEYTAYLRAAAEAIRAADPGTSVIGICCTGDLGGLMAPFIEGCAKRGALDLVDAMTFHPYDSRQDCSPLPADRAIAELRALLAQHGKPDLPLWNSELYYLHPRPVPHEYWDFLWQRGPEVARRHLTDLACGVLRSACVESTSYCQRTLAARSWDDRSRKPVPNRQFVALNTVARLAGGARPVVGGVGSGPGRLHRYIRADGSPLAAAWSADADAAALVLRLPGAAGRITALDVYGNALGLRSDGADLEATLGPDPIYLLPAAGAEAAFAGLADGATIAYRDPWRLEARGSVSPTGDAVVVVAATARTAESLAGSVRVAVTWDGRSLAADERQVTLAGGAATVWTLPLDPPPAPGTALTVSLDAEPGGRPQATATATAIIPKSASCPTLAAAPVVDGVVDAAEWVGAGSLDFPRGDRVGNWLATWRGPDDCSGGLRLGHHQGWLYLAAQVRDDGRGISASDPEAAWNRDAIELFFDLRPDRDWQEDGYGKQGGQLMIGLPAGEGAPLVRNGGGHLAVAGRVRSAWKALPGGWSLEVAIPLDATLAGLRPGAVLGFGAALNDADDAAGARVRLFWAGDRDSWGNRRALGRLVVH